MHRSVNYVFGRHNLNLYIKLQNRVDDMKGDMNVDMDTKS